jgi:sulfatase modifying factor 1
MPRYENINALDMNVPEGALLNEYGEANQMVRIPKFNLNTIDNSWPATPHPAFIVNGVTKEEIWIAKYLASMPSTRARSIVGVDPKHTISYDDALSACAANGAGWHLMTNAEWSAIALWCWKNGKMPRGNTNWGLSSDNGAEGGVRGDSGTNGVASGVGRTNTGSGPITWNHDATAFGIADLCGNVWEWVGGMRQHDGEINIIENNNSAVNTTDHTHGSAAWKAILASDGSLVAPGTAGTLKYDEVAANSTPQLDDVIDFSGSGGCSFESLAADAGITVPDLLKQLCLFPPGAGLGSDYLYLNNSIEGLPIRGGGWSSGSAAGVFGLLLNHARTYADADIGFRPAFVA